jgi:AhpD family alkylhydroperoxidase
VEVEVEGAKVRGPAFPGKLRKSPAGSEKAAFELIAAAATGAGLFRWQHAIAPMGAWTQAAMRGPSTWSVGERELLAAMIAKWNSCAFCVGAHGAVAAKTMERPLVDAVLADFRSAAISAPLMGTLTFLETMTLRPTELSGEQAKAGLRSGVSADALQDAIAVGTVFNIITRYADALHFAIPSAKEFDRAAGMLLKRGYA